MPLNVVLQYARLIEFSNGCHTNTVTMLIDQGMTPIYPKLEMYAQNDAQYQVKSSLPMGTNYALWQHLAASYDGNTMRFYLNAILVGTSEQVSYAMPQIERAQNFLGGSACEYHGSSSSHVDDLRIYARSLTQSQINDVMMASMFDQYKFNASICNEKSKLAKKRIFMFRIFLKRKKTFFFIKLSKDSGINWNGNNWAFNCDFSNHDLSNLQTARDNCNVSCLSTFGCTHFTWTNYQGGTCWMKSGLVKKDDAFIFNGNEAMCGLLV